MLHNFLRLLRFPDPADGGTPTATPPAPAPAPPPAADLVAKGVADEEAIQLRRELENERKARADAEKGRKDAETKAAEFERDRQNLLTPPPPKAEKPKRRFATLLNHPWN